MDFKLSKDSRRSFLKLRLALVGGFLLAALAASVVARDTAGPAPRRQEIAQGR